ncbi:MAG: DUF1134 domain-containing protein, partial [Hyphomicrobiaceae bacterium]|nr:DUF1134 domain-containing protein [Hyphomicrobiaceae bacterium]
MRAFSLRLYVLSLLTFACVVAGALLPTQSQAQDGAYTSDEIVNAGHRFFGSAAGGMATLIERAFQEYGLPNGYVLGEEGAGAVVGGLTYGEGTLFTKNAGDHKVFWQGPSIGWDFG